MARLRELREDDVARIRQWPVYAEDMAQMDYALRENGWLEECGDLPETVFYGVEEHDELIGFSLLSKTAGRDAEFRIALRADSTGRGLGRIVTFLTLQAGFSALGLDRIHLIVRKNNARGISLYRRMGFGDAGECRKTTNGSLVDFWVMAIGREDFGSREHELANACSQKWKEGPA
jgi:RimJ/RimL family protein N-acetyltransferase